MPKGWDQRARLKLLIDHRETTWSNCSAKDKDYKWKLNKENVVFHAATQDTERQKRGRDG